MVGGAFSMQPCHWFLDFNTNGGGGGGWWFGAMGLYLHLNLVDFCSSKMRFYIIYPKRAGPYTNLNNCSIVRFYRNEE